MIEPEVGHHLFELVLGIDGAHQLLGGELIQDLPLRVVAPGLAVGIEVGADLLLVLLVEDGIELRPILVVGNEAVLLRLVANGAVCRIGTEKLGRRQIERRIARETAPKRGLRGSGRELALQPDLGSHGRDGVDLAGARSVGEPGEQMSRRLPAGEPRLLQGRWSGLELSMF